MLDQRWIRRMAREYAAMVDITRTMRVETIAATAELMRAGRGGTDTAASAEEVGEDSKVSGAKKLGGFVDVSVLACRPVSSIHSGDTKRSPTSQARRPRRIFLICAAPDVAVHSPSAGTARPLAYRQFLQGRWCLMGPWCLGCS